MIFKAMMAMKRAGLNDARSGNASIRHANGFYISRTGRITNFKPIFVGPPHSQASSEWRMHKAIYEAFPHINAVIHFHGPRVCKTVLYDAAEAGTQELADQMVAALTYWGTESCYIEDHGNVVIGDSMEDLIGLVEQAKFQAQKNR